MLDPEIKRRYIMGWIKAGGLFILLAYGVMGIAFMLLSAPK